MRRTPRAIRRVLPFRHDAFESHLAGVGEDGRAVALDMLVEPDAGAGLGHDRCKLGLADRKRITPQVVAVQFDEVEGVEEYLVVSAVVPDEIERGNAVVIAGDSFAVDDAGARAQAGQRLDDQREATGEVVARTAVELTCAPFLRAMMRKPPPTVRYGKSRPVPDDTSAQDRSWKDAAKCRSPKDGVWGKCPKAHKNPYAGAVDVGDLLH